MGFGGSKKGFGDARGCSTRVPSSGDACGWDITGAVSTSGEGSGSRLKEDRVLAFLPEQLAFPIAAMLEFWVVGHGPDPPGDPGLLNEEYSGLEYKDRRSSPGKELRSAGNRNAASSFSGMHSRKIARIVCRGESTWSSIESKREKAQRPGGLQVSV